MQKILTLKATGPDAFEFLQGQLSNDLRRLETDAKILSAWCNPKGRVIWFGAVWAIESGFGLSVPDLMADRIVERLKMFRFRAKVDFEIVDEDVTIDPAHLIQNGQPFIEQQQSEQFTPHMLNLDLLDAISLDKGCYTGQEIIARTHYKGSSKRRTLRFECEGPLSVGDKVSYDGRDIGEVLNVAGNDLLAVVPLKNVDQALSVRDANLKMLPLPYLDLAASGAE